MAELADRNNQIKTYKGHYGITGTFAQKIQQLAATSLSYAFTDGLLVVDSTAGEVIITLPLISENESLGALVSEYRHIFPILHIAGTNNIKVQCSGSETFANGATFLNLGKGLGCFDLFVINSVNISKYGLYTPLCIKATATFSGTFDTASFATVAIAPLDTEKINDQDEILLFQALSNGVIASAAEVVVGETVFTDVAHALVTGDVITIAGTTSYNSEYSVTVLTVDTFSIVETFVADESGTWIRSPRLTVLNTGRYVLSYQLKIVSTGGAAWVASGFIYKNGSLLADSTIIFGGLASGTEIVNLAPIDVELAAGDYVDLRVDNDTNLTGALKTALLSIETIA